jgi:hypothetical protein
MTDLLARDLYELTQKLAYCYWEARGRPVGSPELDWSRAEQAVDSLLSASSTRLPFSQIQMEPNEGPYR